MSDYKGSAGASRLRAVLCDLDDTLFDHAHATRAALAHLVAADEAAGRWPIDEVEARHNAILETLHLDVLAGRRTIDTARVERFRRLIAAFGGDESRAGNWAAAYREAYQAGWRAVPGALELLSAARAAGLAVGVVTNNHRREQSLKLTRCGLDSAVDALITSEETGSSKPDAAIFRAALERLGVATDEAVMLGDAWAADIEGARAIRIRAVWYNPLGRLSPDPSVDELRSLTPAADGLGVLFGSGQGSGRAVRPGVEAG
jgi:putative hydrolase of the HAD superfamily